MLPSQIQIPFPKYSMLSYNKYLVIIVPLLVIVTCKQTKNSIMNYSPPTYLKGLVSEVSQQTLSEIQKSYGTNTTAFKFNNNFTRLVQTWLEESAHYGGTVWGSGTTGNKVLLFDQFRHGYNAMMKLNKEEDLTNIKSIDLREPTEIIIAFQYSGDEDEYLERGVSKFKQDYFGWVVIYKKVNDKLEEFFNYECA
jgi:hypothetical protein